MAKVGKNKATASTTLTTVPSGVESGPFHGHLEPRLTGIYNTLMTLHAAGKYLSSSSKGYEREVFIRGFLSRIFPPIYLALTPETLPISTRRGAGRSI